MYSPFRLTFATIPEPVEGTPVLAAVLRDGATLTVGTTQLVFAIGGKRIIRSDTPARIGAITSKSPRMQEVIRHLQRAASTDSTTLLLGETGTGKDISAHAIHQASERAERPLVVVDCGSLPSELIESELFGHVAGAFTGAQTDRAGAFEQAQNGTIFLDEIGELPLLLQSRFLRILDSRRVQRVGGNTSIDLDLRVIAATNRDLRRQVNEGSFREDLYHRLAIIEINLPPLRERREDIPALIDVFLEQLDVSSEGRELIRADDFLQKAKRHVWPGNIRELRNHVERCVALQESMPLLADEDDGTVKVNSAMPIQAARARWLAHFERRYLEELLADESENVTAVARRAGVSRVHMYRLLKAAGLR